MGVMMPNRLKDRVAVVTGAGRGIGRAIALAMADEGAKVVVNDYGVDVDGSKPSKDPTERVVREIKDKGGMSVANYDTVATLDGAKNIIGTTISNFGRIDILVNNAGIIRNRMIFNMTQQEWTDVICVGLKGYFACTKFASAFMREQRSGRIINMTSDAGLIGTSGGANYSAATMGVTGLTKAVAMELGRYGVTVNAVSPLADTRMLKSIPESTERIKNSRRISGANLSRGCGIPEDIAAFVIYLASDEASDVNGQIFSVTGGRVSLYSYPSVLRAVRKSGMWTVDELEEIFGSTFVSELVNPAPSH
jgi:NAD(P)-dependent dehydrogenase (short-subunit alcohol dehydrogenase family)